MRDGNDGRNGNPIAHGAVKIGMSVPPELPPEAEVEVSISQRLRSNLQEATVKY